VAKAYMMIKKSIFGGVCGCFVCGKKIIGWIPIIFLECYLRFLAVF
jgi:hypothetical protein